jgi:hypothetical protein
VVHSSQILSSLLAILVVLTIADARSLPTSSSFSQVKWAKCPPIFGDLGSWFDYESLMVPID